MSEVHLLRESCIHETKLQKQWLKPYHCIADDGDAEVLQHFPGSLDLARRHSFQYVSSCTLHYFSHNCQAGKSAEVAKMHFSQSYKAESACICCWDQCALTTGKSHILDRGTARQEVYTACRQKFSDVKEGNDLQRPTALQLDCPGALPQYWLALHQHNQHPPPPHQQAELRGELPAPQPAAVPATSTRPFSAVQHCSVFLYILLGLTLWLRRYAMEAASWLPGVLIPYKASNAACGHIQKFATLFILQ